MSGTMQIAIINEATHVNQQEFLGVVKDLQRQVDQDFAPIWGITAQLNVFTDSKQLPADQWWLVILDSSDQAGALGYHDLTPTGLPLGKVFAYTSVQSGNTWSVTASHELLEMLVDPYIDLTAFNQQTNTTGVLYAYEVCDPVEDDSQGYVVGSYRVSNFVTPEWFEPNAVVGSKFDFKGLLTKPLTLMPNGYMSVFYVYPNTKGWSQVLGNGRLALPTHKSGRLTKRGMTQAIKVCSDKR